MKTSYDQRLLSTVVADEGRHVRIAGDSTGTSQGAHMWKSAAHIRHSGVENILIDTVEVIHSGYTVLSTEYSPTCGQEIISQNKIKNGLSTYTRC